MQREHAFCARHFHALERNSIELCGKGEERIVTSVDGAVNARADGFYAPDSPSGKRLAAQKAAETRRTNATKRTPRKAAANGRRKATRQTPTRDAVTVEPGEGGALCPVLAHPVAVPVPVARQDHRRLARHRPAGGRGPWRRGAGTKILKRINPISRVHPPLPASPWIVSLAAFPIRRRRGRD